MDATWWNIKTLITTWGRLSFVRHRNNWNDDTRRTRACDEVYPEARVNLRKTRSYRTRSTEDDGRRLPLPSSDEAVRHAIHLLKDHRLPVSEEITNELIKYGANKLQYTFYQRTRDSESMLNNGQRSPLLSTMCKILPTILLGWIASMANSCTIYLSISKPTIIVQELKDISGSEEKLEPSC